MPHDDKNACEGWLKAYTLDDRSPSKFNLFPVETNKFAWHPVYS